MRRAVVAAVALALAAAVAPAQAPPGEDARVSAIRRLDALERWAEFRCGGMRPPAEDLVSTRVIGEEPEPPRAELARRRAREACWARTVGPVELDARGAPAWPPGAEPPPPPDRAAWIREVE